MELKQLPIFKLSLGSKELFHSNFLDFLWDIDHNMFIKIVNGLLPDDKIMPDGDCSKYFIGCEKEKFDICIYHLEECGKKSTKKIYDLIIENKVKSIPYKEQLEIYYNKAKDNKGSKNARYILLSLANDFPDKSIIEEDTKWIEEHGKWNIVNYKDLMEAIEGQKDRWKNFACSKYISDYCDYIGLMHSLQEDILNNFENSPLFINIEDYRDCRLADLYIKLRCAKFLILLKKKLVEKNVPAYYMKANENIREERTERGVYLNLNIFRSVGQVAALIYDGHPKNDLFEIVIQGEEYRHCINSIKYKNVKNKSRADKGTARSKLWSYCKNNGLMSFMEDIPGDGDLFPQCSIKDKSKNKVEKFRGYNDDYVYKFKKIDGIIVSKLLNQMVEDIVKYILKR